MTKLGEQPNDEELEDIVKAVDLNGDGEIDSRGKGKGPKGKGRP